MSCHKVNPSDGVDLENIVTQRSDTLLMLNYENGVTTYRFETPLMERYEYAREPYQEFRKGIFIQNYKDSTHIVTSSLKADYAIFLEKQKLWEVKGNVVGVNEDGMILETQQLFWNQKTHKVYSNVDTKITDKDGNPVIGQGFEAPDDMSDFEFRRPVGKIVIDTDPSEETPDSVSNEAVAVPQASPGDVLRPAR